MTAPAIVVESLRHEFPGAPSHVALDGVSAEIEPGMITGLVGPDGAGKTTLLRLLAGLLRPGSGRISVLGFDMVTEAAQAHPHIGYMPQRFGLYDDLSVAENLDLFADLHAMGTGEREERIARLLQFTALAPFTTRLAGQLSGGMKQKLGLACALLSRPQVLLLDEPSVGVDPASRRELWAIVSAMLQEGGDMAVVWATAYLDEAERCGRVLLLHEGRLLADEPPATFLAPLAGRVFVAPAADGRRQRAREIAMRAGVLDAQVAGDVIRVVLREGVAPGLEWRAVEPRFEDGFIARLAPPPQPSPAARESGQEHSLSRLAGEGWGGGAAITVTDLIRRFGNFTAVDHISFSVARGEIFGLLGPNGAGKSTTFRMLCGLLRPSGGEARVAGQDLLRAPAAARGRVGYMAQRFSLYGELSVRENLRFFARVYGLDRRAQAQAIDRALQQFELAALADEVAGELPLGLKQRLALAAALLHQPEILFLDEPTSGVDPLTRREFWARMGALADDGVTILVTSHFMDEAEYCDRLAIVSQGRLAAIGTPAELRARVRTPSLPEPTLEDAFIALVQGDQAALAA